MIEGIFVVEPEVYLIMRWISLLAVASVCLFNGCHYINQKLNVKDDWIGEEVLEEVIEYQTGIDVDLTP